MFDVKSFIKEPAPGERFDPPLGFYLFDKRALQPLDWLVHAVQGETGETVSLGRLEQMAAESWFPLIEGPWLESGQLGSPLYTPSRIGMLLKLERDGYGPDELREVAAGEEWYIDNILTTDDWAYEDDDVELLIRYAQARLEGCERELQSGFRSQSVEKLEEEAENYREFVKNYAWRSLETLPLKMQNHLLMAAFELRFNQELLRVQLLDMERSQILAGYSSFVFFSAKSFSPTRGFKGEGINWRLTLEGREGVDLPIRLPGVVLRQGLVHQTRTLNPREYERLWREYRLDEYVRTLATLRDIRLCCHCLAELPSEVGAKRMYCGENCRNAARQKRFRQRRPDQVIKILEKYWSEKPN
jgi:hypothetical protein